MRKLLFVCVAVLAGLNSFGQSVTKMDYYLATKDDAYKTRMAEAKTMLPILIEGNISTIKQLVKENGGTFKYSYGNIAAIVIPVSALPAFNSNKEVIRMEGAPQHYVPCNDTMRKRNSIVQVQQGKFPLTQKYNGKGIVIGFVDTGIDYKHPDFIDSTGHSRVKYYWDQNQPIGIFTPLPYGYGQAWTEAEIDADLANDTSSYDDYSHGSNVAGVACSNGRANGLEEGGCPSSDIVFVALNFNGPASDLTDAINYIYTVADSLNEPCVLNASLGSYDGSHDGLDLQALMIDSMILAKQPGRVFVAAAGNAGGIPFHLHDSLPNATDSTCTWFSYDAGNGNVDIQLFANVADFNNINFAIECDKVTPGSYSTRARTIFSNISAHLAHIDSTYLVNAAHDTIAKVKYYAQIYYPGNYSMEYVITTDSTSSAYNWMLITKGQGRFDSWDWYSTVDIVDTSGFLLNQTKYPEMQHYVMPDVNQTICSSFQCSSDVITVANYNNRACYEDSQLRDTCYAKVPGALAPSSSWGPTRNYTLIKPDIGGAGAVIMSALATDWQAAYLSGAPTACDPGGWHEEDGGTSLASPGVAAVAALYLEKNPTVKNHEVWYAITHCDSVDGFTGACPNYKFGYGKVNAFKALTQCSPPAAVPEVAEPANVAILKAYPNPVISSTTVEYDFSGIRNFTQAQIEFYDVLGKKVKTVLLSSNSGTVNITKNTLSSGMYFYSLIVDGSRIKTEKLDVL